MRGKNLVSAVTIGLAIALIAPAGVLAATLNPKFLAKAGYGSVAPSFVRTADGTLHVVLQSNTNWGDSFNGIGAISISPSGQVGPEVQAVNWQTASSPNGTPGVAVMPGGALEAVFGGSPSGDNGPWGISSTNGGASWTAPSDVGSGSMEAGEGQITLQESNGTPVFTGGCCGGIVLQQGFGPGKPTYLVTNNSDDAAGNVDTAVDAATGAVVAAWDSNAGSGGLWLQQVAPTAGTAQLAPLPSQYGTGVPLILAGRDTGSGVFAAYPSNSRSANTTKMRLLRYGGGSVSVGSAKHLHVSSWGVATGSDGRIWVFWAGTNVKTGKYELAVTRSNSANTAFEPIQTTYLTFFGGFSTLSGDGRLGPLDMLISGYPTTPGAQTAFYYARFVPELAARVKVANLGGGKFKLKVHVTDAGDPVNDATASSKGSSKKVNGTGHAKLIVSGSSGRHATVKISAPGYKTVKERIRL